MSDPAPTPCHPSPKLRVIYGLSGAGKTRRMKHFEQGYLFDDFIHGRPIAETPQWKLIVDALCKGDQQVILADRHFCDVVVRANLVAQLRLETLPPIAIQWFAFDCLRAEAVATCASNCYHRHPPTAPICVSNNNKLLRTYTIEPGATVLPVVLAQ